MSTNAKNRNEKSRPWAEITALLLDRTVVLIGLVYITIMVILVWRQAQLEDRLVESAAQEEARRYTEALATFRTLYTREVVETVRRQDIVVTHDYDQGENKGKAIPLPATLSMMIGNEMAKQELGGQTIIFVETEEGLMPRTIAVGRSDEDSVEITAGLRAGDRYVASGGLALKAELNKAALEHAGPAQQNRIN